MVGVTSICGLLICALLVLSHMCDGNIHPQNLVLICQIWGDKEFLSFISGKLEWESPPSILVIRNLN